MQRRREAELLTDVKREQQDVIFCCSCPFCLIAEITVTGEAEQTDPFILECFCLLFESKLWSVTLWILNELFKFLGCLETVL